MARSTSTSGAKKTSAKKSAAATKASTTKTSAKKASTKKTSTKKAAPAKKTTTKKASTKKAAPAKKTSTKTASKSTAKTSTATKTSAKKSTPARTRTKAKTLAPKLVVREDESPWTKTELKGVRQELETEVARLRDEIEVAEHELVDLMRDHADGAGDDQADQGAKTFEREQEITLANNARAMLVQNLHALERLEDGTYGQCESCGNPIGKLRLQAYPRATLCVACKTKQERR